MPIRPELRCHYGPDWDEISRERKQRAGGRCVWCGAVHGAPHPDTGSTVVLTTAHLNHDAADRSDDNLASLCQRCHLAHDRDHHRRAAAATRRRKMGTLDLPLNLFQPPPRRLSDALMFPGTD